VARLTVRPVGQVAASTDARFSTDVSRASR
jgi:hypothetical protein